MVSLLLTNFILREIKKFNKFPVDHVLCRPGLLALGPGISGPFFSPSWYQFY